MSLILVWRSLVYSDLPVNHSQALLNIELLRCSLRNRADERSIFLEMKLNDRLENELAWKLLELFVRLFLSDSKLNILKSQIQILNMLKLPWFGSSDALSLPCFANRWPKGWYVWICQPYFWWIQQPLNSFPTSENWI